MNFEPQFRNLGSMASCYLKLVFFTIGVVSRSSDMMRVAATADKGTEPRGARIKHPWPISLAALATARYKRRCSGTCGSAVSYVTRTNSYHTSRSYLPIIGFVR
ncbi:hypothetical protein P692DRAFT_20446654 [Suillus brevipes Sb2]|nr:hypothetical protein P692DRAFT_20446654 [Suillus brevipes Sb2]